MSDNEKKPPAGGSPGPIVLSGLMSLVIGVIIGAVLYSSCAKKPVAQECSSYKSVEEMEEVMDEVVERKVNLQLIPLKNDLVELEEQMEGLEGDFKYNNQRITQVKEHVVTWKEAVCQMTGKCLDPPKKCPACPKLKCVPADSEVWEE